MAYSILWTYFSGVADYFTEPCYNIIFFASESLCNLQ